jgi:hypothetical protein
VQHLALDLAHQRSVQQQLMVAVRQLSAVQQLRSTHLLAGATEVLRRLVAVAALGVATVESDAAVLCANAAALLLDATAESGSTDADATVAAAVQLERPLDAIAAALLEALSMVPRTAEVPGVQAETVYSLAELAQEVSEGMTAADLMMTDPVLGMMMLIVSRSSSNSSSSSSSNSSSSSRVLHTAREAQRSCLSCTLSTKERL